MAVDSTTRIANAQNAATRAEREAADRIQESQKRIQKAAKEEEKQIDGLRDQYEKRTEVERARGDNYIETVRNRTYETLAETRRKAEIEKQRVSRMAEKDLKELDAHYSEATLDANQRGEVKLKEATKQGFEAEQAERKRYAEEMAMMKADYDLMKAQLESERRETGEKLTKDTQNYRKEAEARARTDIENANEHYQGVYEGAMKQTKDSITDVNWRASREVEALKRETAQKLDAYSTQKSDPFYRMVNVSAKIRETPEQFILTAQVPTHEQDKININVRGNELVISGKRKSEEKLDAGPGHTLRTNAYQSFSETFPLGWPVDPKFMTREWDGEELTVRIPKRSTYEAPRPKPEVTKASLERPSFPKNLPTEKQLIAANSEKDENGKPIDPSIPPSKRRPGATVG